MATKKKATRAFVENLAEMVAVLQMWVEKHGSDFPVTAAYLVYAIDDVQKAHFHALNGE